MEVVSLKEFAELSDHSWETVMQLLQVLVQVSRLAWVQIHGLELTLAYDLRFVPVVVFVLDSADIRVNVVVEASFNVALNTFVVLLRMRLLKSVRLVRLVAVKSSAFFLVSSGDRARSACTSTFLLSMVYNCLVLVFLSGFGG